MFLNLFNIFALIITDSAHENYITVSTKVVSNYL